MGPTLACGELAFYSRRGTTPPGSRESRFSIFIDKEQSFASFCMQGRCKTHRRTLLGFSPSRSRLEVRFERAVSIREPAEPQSAAPLSSTRRRWSWRISPRGRSRGYGARRRPAKSRPVRFRTLVDESGFREGPVRRPGGRREGRGSSATRPLLVFGHRGRARSRLQKTLCAAPFSVPMKSPAAGGGVPSRPPAGRKGSTSQSMLRRARLSNTPKSRE